MDFVLGWVKDFSKLTPATLFAIGALIGLCAGLAIGVNVVNKRLKWDARMLTHASLMIALSFLLSYVKFYKWPQGGSITPASMLPVMAFAYMYGTPHGLVVGFAYSLLQIIQGAYVVHPLQMLLDYPLAFSVLGLAGLARKIRLPESASFLRLPLGVFIGGLARTICHTIAGVIFFWEYAPPGQSALIYSISVNFTVIGVDTLICIVVAAIPAIAKLFPMRTNPESLPPAI